MNRREFVIAATSIVVAACGSASSPTTPTSTTPLIDALRRDGYTVEEQKNSVGGVSLLINGQLMKIKVGTVLVGIDPSMGFDPDPKRPPTENMAQYAVPDNLGYVLVG